MYVILPFACCDWSSPIWWQASNDEAVIDWLWTASIVYPPCSIATSFILLRIFPNVNPRNLSRISLAFSKSGRYTVWTLKSFFDSKSPSSPMERSNGSDPWVDAPWVHRSDSYCVSSDPAEVCVSWVREWSQRKGDTSFFAASCTSWRSFDITPTWPWVSDSIKSYTLCSHLARGECFSAQRSTSCLTSCLLSNVCSPPVDVGYNSIRRLDGILADCD